MKNFIERYLNEVVGLTIMALMAVALIFGRADAGPQRAVMDDAREVIDIRLGISD